MKQKGFYVSVETSKQKKMLVVVNDGYLIKTVLLHYFEC